MITVLFFGPVAEHVGVSRLDFEFHPGLRVQDVRETLQRRYPEAFELVSLAALNGEHVRDFAVELDDRSELVFMSKFSGG